MITHPGRFLSATLLAVASTLASAGADTPAIIVKARAYLGTDKALNAVTSVHFTGTLIATGTVKGADNKADIEIIFQKPYQQRVTSTVERTIPAKKAGEAPVIAKTTETTGLDNYDGWRQLLDPANPSGWNLTLMDALRIKRLRANTWENLAYFIGLERGGVEFEDLGDVTVDGVACRKVVFRHTKPIVFFRYFDRATGRLVLTETDDGQSIREEGEMMVNGIRFPKKVITLTKETDGKQTRQLTLTVTFDSIKVNEVFPASTFAIPPFRVK